jgi:heptosyltransferase-2
MALGSPALEDQRQSGGLKDSAMKVRISTNKPLDQANNILIRGTNWIGDVVMTLPAIAAIRKTFPQAKISVLVKPWVAETFNLCPDVDEVIIYQRPGAHSGITGLFRLIKELRARKFDAAILLQNAIEAAIITLLAGIPIRAGYNSDARGLLLTHSVKRTKTTREIHQIHYYLEMVKSLGCKSADTDAYLQLPDDYGSLANRLIQEHGIDNHKLFVGMAPGATYGAAKKWYPERFALVADRLSEDFSAEIILFGSKGDQDSADAVQRHAKQKLINVAGKTNLREAIALIARCRLFISNDSGLMHVAGALNISTIAIFGSTNPLTTSPPGNRSVVIHKNVSCAPCLKQTCPKSFECMDQISAGEVYEAAKKQLMDRK